MEIRSIPNNELKQWWGFVKPGLEVILKKSPEPWIPEDVYAQCFCGNAVLWIYVEHNQPLGFMVLIQRESTVHVWCLWAKNRDRLEEGSKIFWDALRKNNINRVTFESHRKGWDKVARQHGFTPRSWEKEI